MSQQNDTQIVTLVAGEALEAFRRVKKNGTTSRSVVYADAGEDFYGVTQAPAASGANVPVKTRFGGGSFKVTVAGDTTAANADLYGAADGKVSTTQSGDVQFVGLERGTADGAIIEALPWIEPAASVLKLTITGADLAAAGTGTATIQVVDAAGNAVAGNYKIRTWIGNADDFGPDAQTDYSVSTGAQLEEVVANADYEVITDATGQAVMAIDHGGAGTVYAWAELDGKVYESGAIALTAP